MTKLYGNLPVDLGLVGENINCDEMMFYLYLPIKRPGQNQWYLGDSRLQKYYPIVHKVYSQWANAWLDKYVYLTAKTLYVSPGNTGQRPGWHSDGFMTDDINYIWYTDVPTVFWEPKQKVTFTQEHKYSLSEMRLHCNAEFEEGRAKVWQYPSRHLLRLDETVIHKTDDASFFTGVRTFVKISVSDHIYAHKGNSINPDVNLDVEYIDRDIERNCPITHRN